MLQEMLINKHDKKIKFTIKLNCDIAPDQQYPVYLEVLESEIVYQMDAEMLDEEEEEEMYLDKLPHDYSTKPCFVPPGT